MLSLFDSFRSVDFLSVLLRMIIACLCGTLIGLERSAKNRPAGFRTHILVCLGGAMASMTSLYLYLNLNYPADVSRIGASVVSGLGFIGAGTIIITKKKTIKGLTTAAGLWTCGIIGLAIGSGYYELGLLGTGMVLFTETVLARMGRLIQQNPVYVMELTYQKKDSLDEVLRLCKDHRMSVVNLQIETNDQEENKVYDAVITLRGKAKIATLLSLIRLKEGILSVETR